MYALRKLAAEVDDSFIRCAKNYNLNNSSWQGWVFELAFLQRFHCSTRHNVPCSMFGDNNVTQFSRNISVIREYDGSKLKDLSDGTVFIPFKWNQGCFDAVYYFVSDGIRHFMFFGATIAETHDYKFQYIATFLDHAIGTPAFRAPNLNDVRVSMVAVTSTNNFDRHDVTKGTRDDVASVTPYDETFAGNVCKYHFQY